MTQHGNSALVVFERLWRTLARTRCSNIGGQGRHGHHCAEYHAVMQYEWYVIAQKRQVLTDSEEVRSLTSRRCERLHVYASVRIFGQPRLLKHDENSYKIGRFDGQSRLAKPDNQCATIRMHWGGRVRLFQWHFLSSFADVSVLVACVVLVVRPRWLLGRRLLAISFS